MGSGLISVPVFESLLNSEEIDLAGAATQEDHPCGRGKKTTATPLGQAASDHGFPIDKPRTVNSPEFHDRIRKISPDMIFVLSFGQILREATLSLPRLGCINLHASILPSYRGASPISAAILNGDASTGVSFMKMDKGLDTGPVYRIFEIEIMPLWTSHDLEMALGVLGARHSPEILSQICDGSLQARAQDDHFASHAGKIRKEDGRISWSEKADAIERKIRAYYPWPGASFEIVGEGFCVHMKASGASVIPELAGPPGKILVSEKGELIVCCGSGALRLEKVIPEGKREMAAEEFLRGFRYKIEIANIQ